MKPLVLSLAALFVAATTARAAGRHALILCNQNYKSIGVLKTPLAEADEAKKTLAGLGFEGNITVVTDATTAKMTEAVDAFASKLTDADVALFFYGGHAVQAGGENYLLGTDSDPATNSQLAYKALPLGRVLTNFESSGARLKLLILDCCRDNPLAASGRSIGSMRGLAPTANAPKGTFIAYAADANQQAWDDHGQIGLYGSVLFDKMKTPGLRLEDIFIQTREEVAKIAKDKYSHQQEPAEYSKVSGAFYFSNEATKLNASSSPITSKEAPAYIPAIKETRVMELRGEDEPFHIKQTKPNLASVFVDLGQEFCFEKDGVRRFKLISKSTRALEDAGNTQQTNQTSIVLKIRVVTTGQEFELVQGRETEVSIRQ